jgi:hypothetical protein
MEKRLTKKEALKKIGYIAVNGRPRIGDICLDKITVKRELKEAFEKKAKKERISIPEAHRKALRLYAYGTDIEIDLE